MPKNQGDFNSLLEYGTNIVHLHGVYHDYFESVEALLIANLEEYEGEIIMGMRLY